MAPLTDTLTNNSAIATEKHLLVIPVSVVVKPLDKDSIEWVIYTGGHRAAQGVVANERELQSKLTNRLRAMQVAKPMLTHIVDDAMTAFLARQDVLATVREAWADMFEAGPSEFDMSNLIRGSWECPHSPDSTCWYDNDRDPCWDQCIFCGDPDERK